MKKSLSKIDGKFDIDDLAAILQVTERYSLMPEIHEFLGDKRFLEFIDQFGGLVITVPKRKEIAKSIRIMHIYRVLSKDSSRPQVERLASIYSISPEQVRKHFRDATWLIEQEANQLEGALAAKLGGVEPPSS